MCGRFVFLGIEYLEQVYKANNQIGLFPDSYNVSPGSHLPTISRNPPNTAVLRRWGLIPSWAKDEKIGYNLINARSETVSEKPSYSHSFKYQRCIVPMSGYYEWKREGKTKLPHYIHSPHNRFLSVAGLYAINDKVGSKPIETFTILTTHASERVSLIHDRMPVILTSDVIDVWLNTTTPYDHLFTLLQPFDGDLEVYPVSSEVNRAANNYPELIEEVSNS